MAKHFGSLDGIRAIAIIAVIWHHASRGEALPFALEGEMGVRLFFAISGFLITTLLLRERDRTGEISLRAFYVRRSLRIFPLYYTVLVGYTLVVLLVETSPDAKAAFFTNLRWYLSYTSNWFVAKGDHVIFYFAWSLAAEEQFYLVWPGIEKWLGGRSRRLPVLLALALAVLWTLVSTKVVALDGMAQIVILSIAPAILFGVVLAHVLHDERTYSLAARVLGKRWMSLVMLALVLWSVKWGGTAGTLGAFVCMTLFIGACVVNEDHALAPMLKWRPLVSIGKVSYGIYLMHMLALNVVERVLGRVGVEGRLPAFILTTLFAWGVAWLSFRYYESRWLALKAPYTR